VRQIAMVCLEELVAAEDRYRRIDELVGGWGFVREAARPHYSDGVGRPSIDPTVLLKLMIAGALEGIGSMRELLRVAGLRLDLRLFLGYGLGERLPAHQTISEAQTRRFADGEVFERLFLCTVALCQRHGLIEGSHLSVDGFHAEANAALGSLRASLEPVAGDAGGAGEEAPPPEPPRLRLAEPRSGPTPRRAPFVIPPNASFRKPLPPVFPSVLRSLRTSTCTGPPAVTSVVSIPEAV